MRVVYYVNGWPPGRFANGIVSAVGFVAPALRELGCEVTILAHQAAEGRRDPFVTVLDETVPLKREFGPLRILRDRLSPGRERYESTPRRLVTALTAIPHDLFEMEESFGWSAAVAGKAASAVVTRLHGPWFINGAAAKGNTPFDAEDDLRIRREGEAIAAAEFISSPSQYVLNAVRDRYRLPLAGAVVIPNPVAPTPDAAAWRIDRADPNELLFVGRFDLHKGGDVVLRAFAIAAAQRPNLKLTFVGPSDNPIAEGGKTRSRAEFVAQELSPDAAQRVIFTGPLPHAQIGGLRQRAFATLIGSRDENFPSALLEAIAAGSPVVATAVGGIPEIVRHGEEAVLAPPADPAAMAAAILALLDDPLRAAQLGGNARRRARSEYAPESVARTFLAFYADVAERHGRAS